MNTRGCACLPHRPPPPHPTLPCLVPLAVFGLRGSWRAAWCCFAPRGFPARGKSWEPWRDAARKTRRKPGSSGAAGGKWAPGPRPRCPAAADSGSLCSEPHRCTPGRAAELRGEAAWERERIRETGELRPRNRQKPPDCSGSPCRYPHPTADSQHLSSPGQ